MTRIKIMCDAIEHNIDEAEEHMETAYEMYDDCRDITDWFRNMADVHLKFNDGGHNVVRKLIDNAKARYENDEMLPGMLAVYNAKHADLVRQSAKVRSMIDNYGK